MAPKGLRVPIDGDPTGLLAAFTSTEAAAGGWGSKLGSIATAASVALVAGGVAAGVALYKIGATFDEAYDTIRTGTGATGDALSGLEDDFKAVVSSVPASFGDASTAIADINTRLGLTGAPLQTISSQFLELSRITKSDVGANIETVTGLFNNFGVGAADQGTKLDLLFRASQATGVSVGDLASQMTDSGSVLRSVGLDFDSSAALVASLGKAGLSASDVMPALSKAMGVAAKSGKDAGTVLSDTFATIQNAPDATSAAGAAVEVFGAKAGPKFAEMIRSGQLSYGDLLGQIQGGSETILGAGQDTQDFGEKWDLFKNRVLVALEPIATRVFSAIGDLMTIIGEKAGPVLAELTGGFTALIAAFQAGGNDVTSSGLAGAMERIGLVARSVWDALSSVDWAGIASTIGGVLATAFQALGTVVGVLSDHLDILIPFVATLGAAWLVYQGYLLAVEAVSWLVATATAAVNAVMDANPITLVVIALAALVAGLVWAYNNVGWFHDAVDTAWQGIQSVISWAWESVIKPIFDNWEIAITVLLGPIGLLAAVLIDNWNTITAAASWAWSNILQPIFDNWQLALTVILGPLGFLVAFIVDNWNTIAGIISWAWGSVIQPIWSAIQTYITGFLIPSLQILWAVAQAAWSGIASAVSIAWTIVSAVWSAIGSVLQGVLIPAFQIAQSVISGVWSGIGSSISSAWGGIQGVFSLMGSAIDGIKSAFSGISTTVSNVFGGLSGIVSSALNAVKNAWNNTIGGKGISIPSVFGFGGADFTIPRLHSGGVFNAPTPGGEGFAWLRDGETVITPGGAVSTATSYRGGDTTINIYQQPGESTDELVDRLFQYDRRNGGVLNLAPA